MKNTIHDDNNTRAAAVYIRATFTHQYSLWQAVLQTELQPQLLAADDPLASRRSHNQPDEQRTLLRTPRRLARCAELAGPDARAV